jgi:RNA polymerase sigma-70 factor, ECF subfamily
MQTLQALVTAAAARAAVSPPAVPAPTTPPTPAGGSAGHVADHRSAFDALFATYRAPIHSYVARLVGDREDAADLTQDAFLKAYLALPRLRPDHVQAWLYRIATNVCLDALRHRALLRWTSLEGCPRGAGGGAGSGSGTGSMAPATPLAALWRSGRPRCPGADGRPQPLGLTRAPDPDADPERCALRAEQAGEVRAVLERLPPRHRAVLALREWHGLAYAEIGAALGLSRKQTKHRLFRARAAFRREWSRTRGPWPGRPAAAPAAATA